MWNILKESVLSPRYTAPQCRRTFFSCGAGSRGPWGLSPRSFSRETAGSQLGVAEHFSRCSRHSVQCDVVTNDLSPRPERISVPSASPPPPLHTRPGDPSSDRQRLQSSYLEPRGDFLRAAMVAEGFYLLLSQRNPAGAKSCEEQTIH